MDCFCKICTILMAYFLRIGNENFYFSKKYFTPYFPLAIMSSILYLIYFFGPKRRTIEQRNFCHS